VTNYVDTIRSEFNLKRIKKFIDTSDIFVTVDCQNSPISAFLRPILAEIGLEDCILDENARPDFGGTAPRTDASSAGESMQLFNTKGPSMDDLLDIEAAIYGRDDGENEKRKADGDDSKVEDEADDAPDLGFAFDADAHTCMVR
jgi:phosphomannomutase